MPSLARQAQTHTLSLSITLIIITFILPVVCPSRALAFQEETTFTPLEDTAISWADYDQDGDPDLLLTGDSDGSTGQTGETRLLRNDGGGNFTHVMAGLINVDGGGTDWADYDNDGDLDLLLVGRTEPVGNPETQVYRNDGGGTFTAINDGMIDLRNGDAKWFDFDNDSRPDVVITGEDISANLVTNVYQNQGSGNFVFIAGVTGAEGSDLSIADFNQDGLLDFFLTGSGSSGPISELYQNNFPTMGTFSPISSGFLGVEIGDSAWADFDGDGDLDIVITGQVSPGFENTTLYENLRPGFSPVTSANLPDASFSDVAWADVDTDGDPDLLLQGIDSGGATFAQIHFNSGGSFSSTESLPGHSFGDAAFADYDLDGDIDLVVSGEDETGIPSTQLLRNDSGKTFDIIANTLIDGQANSVAWGDYDNDGDQDVLVLGEDLNGDALTVLLANNGNGLLGPVSTNLPDVIGGDSAWGDYNNDGRLDILITGITGTQAGGFNPFSTILRNDGAGLFTDISSTAPINPVAVGTVSWVDFNTDGALDAFVSGDNTTTLYRNDGGGVFSSLSGTNLPGFADPDAAWADFDLDDDPDLAIAGNDATTGNRRTQVFENQGGGTFGTSGNTLLDLSDASVAWSDVDVDGDPDLFIMGSDGPASLASRLYRNDGMGNLNEGAPQMNHF